MEIAYIADLPCGRASPQAVTLALHKFGVKSWIPIEADQQKASGYLQFVPNTKPNIEEIQSAVKDTGGTVFTALKRLALSASSQTLEAVAGWTSTEPDGTLADDDADIPYGMLDDVRNDIRRFRELALEAQRELLSGKRNSELEAEFKQFKGLDAIRTDMIEETRSRLERADTEYRNKLKDQEPKIAESQLQEFLKETDGEPIQYEDIKARDLQLEGAIEATVTEYFGQPESTLIDHITGHIASGGTKDELAEYLLPTLEEDSAEFCAQLWAALGQHSS